LSAKRKKINLLGFSHESLVDFFHSIQQPSFRALQLMKWIHQRGVTDFIKMTDFSLELRNQLTEIAEVKPPKVEECLLSELRFEKFSDEVCGETLSDSTGIEGGSSWGRHRLTLTLNRLQITRGACGLRQLRETRGVHN